MTASSSSSGRTCAVGAALPLRPELAGLHPYGAPQDAVPIRLNVNENPFPPSAALREAIAQAVYEAAGSLNRYPDRDFLQLRAALAEYLNEEAGLVVAGGPADCAGSLAAGTRPRRALSAEQIWAANGSNEVMLHLLQAYGGPGRLLLATTPSYSMYPEYARDTCTDFLAVARRSDFTLDMPALLAQIAQHRPALVVIPSPNNPTGTALPLAQTEELLAACRGSGPIVAGQATDTILVIDEAYAEFRRDGVESALSLLSQYPHLVVTRTMSKAFGAAGLRLGYLAAATQVISDLMIVRLPYHLSALTQAAALAALQHRGELREQVALLRQERDRVVAKLCEYGFTVAVSDANFVLFGVFADAPAVFQALRERGILLRVVGPQGWLRVSIGTPAENDAVLAALAEVACPVQNNN